jgi:hypothetical protein
MKRRFFIYSLPRSGSAWLSEFLSQPGCYCYHDPFADGDWDDLAFRWDNRPESCVGAIDTSAHQRTPSGQPRVCERLVLLREPTGIFASLTKIGLQYDYPLATEVERLKFAARGAFPIYYERLHELCYLEDVWEMVTNTPLDFERAARLIEMNIQRSAVGVLRRMRAAT